MPRYWTSSRIRFRWVEAARLAIETRYGWDASRSPTTDAPTSRSEHATGNKNGPLPATSTRLPTATRSTVAKWRAHPGVQTPGKVHPGNGIVFSYAPDVINNARPL